MFKKPWSIAAHSPGFCALLLLAFCAVSTVEGNLCEGNKPCNGAGGCFLKNPSGNETLDVFSTHCVCFRGYSGNWCQFNDLKDGRTHSNEKQLNRLPGLPMILHDRSSFNDNGIYLLTWIHPRNSSTPVQYYSVRYKIMGDSRWVNSADRIRVYEAKKTYIHQFGPLYPDVYYEVQIYAGSIEGAGEPARHVIRRPRIDFPEIVNVTEDQTGEKAVLLETPFHIECEARGEPPLNFVWFFNENVFPLETNNSEVTDGSLTVRKAKSEHSGVYICQVINRWGTVRSRPVRVEITGNATFEDNKAVNFTFVIGYPVVIHCPKHSGGGALTYFWGNADNYIIPEGKTVWVTTNGTLVHSPSSFDVIISWSVNIRCFVRQKTASGVTTIMSGIVELNPQADRSKFGDGSFRFLEKFNKHPITLFRGDSLELHCSSVFRGKTSVVWDTGNSLIRFRNKVNITNFGRVLKYNNLQKADSGKIVCITRVQYFNLDTVYRISTFLNVVDGPEDFIGKFPRELSVYRDSKFRLGKKHFESSINFTWYKDGDILNNTLPWYDFPRTATTGIYQLDATFGQITYTTATFVQFIDELNHGSNTRLTGVRVDCIPPAMYSQYDFNVSFHPSCTSQSSKIVDNSLVVTEEPAERLKDCSCVFNPSSYVYSISRDLELSYKDSWFPLIEKWLWSQWSHWSHCPRNKKACGKTFSHHRHRSCYNPSMYLRGEYCYGESQQSQQCPVIPCKSQAKRGNWTEWTQWSTCSKTCGTGSRMRERRCLGNCAQGIPREHESCVGRCTFSDRMNEMVDKMYSEGVRYIPNVLALLTIVFVILLGCGMACRECFKNSLSKTKHANLLQDLFFQPEWNVERQPLLETESRPPPMANKRPPSKRAPVNVPPPPPVIASASTIASSFIKENRSSLTYQKNEPASILKKDGPLPKKAGTRRVRRKDGRSSTSGRSGSLVTSLAQTLPIQRPSPNNGSPLAAPFASPRR